MGCTQSSSKSIVKTGGHFSLKTKVLGRYPKKRHCQKSNIIKSSTVNKTFSTLNLEQILDGQAKHLIKRFELDSACLLFDASLTHILVLDNKRLCLINMITMNIDTFVLLIDTMDIQEIVWSSQLNKFLILTTSQLYETGIDQLQLTPIHQIQVRIKRKILNSRMRNFSFLFC